MSAQATLAGIEAPAADVMPHIGIAGVLAERPELRTMTNGDLILQALVQQHVHGRPHALPVLISRVWRTQDAPHVTYQLVHALHASLVPGIEVIARGAGIEHSHHQGRDVLRLLECSLLEPVQNLPTLEAYLQARQAHAAIVQATHPANPHPHHGATHAPA